MGMTLSMGLDQRLEQQLEQRLGLTLTQHLSILMNLRLSAIEALHGIKYDPNATCPKCSFNLEMEHILKGFSDNVEDWTTECPKCEERFVPNLRNISRSGSSTINLPFLCPDQALHELKRLTDLSSEQIQKKEPAVYHSAVTHFGSLLAAFEWGGIVYPFKEQTLADWREKVAPFLGKMPDTEIARLVGCSPSSIRRARKKRGVEAFSMREHVEANN